MIHSTLWGRDVTSGSCDLNCIVDTVVITTAPDSSLAIFHILGTIFPSSENSTDERIKSPAIEMP